MLSPLVTPPNADSERLLRARIPRVLQDRTVGMIVASFFAVHRELGHGFVDSVYQRALALEFGNRSLVFEQEAAISVFYKGVKVGHYRTPFIVEGRVVVEIRSGSRLDPLDERQLINCVKASGCEAGVLLNFGPAAVFRHAERDAVIGHHPLPGSPSAASS
ncbi:MAG: GxxExxY protein [Gemmatimonadaceae bacterium]